MFGRNIRVVLGDRLVMRNLRMSARLSRHRTRSVQFLTAYDDQLVSYLLTIGRNSPHKVMPEEAREALKRLDRAVKALQKGLDKGVDAEQNPDIGWLIDRILDPRAIEPESKPTRRSAKPSRRKAS